MFHSQGNNRTATKRQTGVVLSLHEPTNEFGGYRLVANFLIFALGIIAGVVVAIGVELFRHYYFRPQLVISEDRPEVGNEYSCHSLVVTNVGRRIAEEAQGFISIEDVQPTDMVPDNKLRFGRDLGLDPVKFGVTSEETIYLRAGSLREIDEEPLCWSTVNSRNSIGIYPGTKRLLDICRFININGHHQIQIPSALGWQALLVSLQPKRYRIWIRVVAQSTPPKVEPFTIDYDGYAVTIRKGHPRKKL